MAVLFNGSTANGIDIDSAWHSQSPQPLLIVVKTKTAATQDQGRIFSGDNGVNNTYSLFAARTNPGGPLGYRVVSARTSGGPHRMAVLSTAEFDGVYRTIAIQRASTPGGSHFAYVDGASSAINEDNNTGTYASASPASDSCIGNNQAGGSAPYDGGIQYLYIWQNTLATEGQVQALSADVPWYLTGLGAPSFGAVFEGTTNIFTGQTVNANNNAGYESNVGTALYYPTDPEIDVATATPPTEVQYNLGKHKLQALPITIGAGVGV